MFIHIQTKRRLTLTYQSPNRDTVEDPQRPSASSFVLQCHKLFGESQARNKNPEKHQGFNNAEEEVCCVPVLELTLGRGRSFRQSFRSFLNQLWRKSAAVSLISSDHKTTPPPYRSVEGSELPAYCVTSELPVEMTKDTRQELPGDFAQRSMPGSPEFVVQGAYIGPWNHLPHSFNAPRILDPPVYINTNPHSLTNPSVTSDHFTQQHSPVSPETPVRGADEHLPHYYHRSFDSPLGSSSDMVSPSPVTNLFQDRVAMSNHNPYYVPKPQLDMLPTVAGGNMVNSDARHVNQGSSSHSFASQNGCHDQTPIPPQDSHVAPRNYWLRADNTFLGLGQCEDVISWSRYGNGGFEGAQPMPPYAAILDIDPASQGEPPAPTADGFPRQRCDICHITCGGKYGKGNLARHKKYVHGNPPKGSRRHCRFCPKEFRRSDAALKHERRKHPELMP